MRCCHLRVDGRRYAAPGTLDEQPDVVQAGREKRSLDMADTGTDV